MFLGSVVNTCLIGWLGRVSRLWFLLQILEQYQTLFHLSESPSGMEDKLESQAGVSELEGNKRSLAADCCIDHIYIVVRQ
jgi:hypothetical protein